MTQTRTELDRRLDELAAQLPGILAETAPESHADAFAGIADEILEAAGDTDRAHVWGRLQCIGRDNGVMPGDEELCGG